MDSDEFELSEGPFRDVQSEDAMFAELDRIALTRPDIVQMDEPSELHLLRDTYQGKKSILFQVPQVNLIERRTAGTRQACDGD